MINERIVLYSCLDILAIVKQKTHIKGSLDDTISYRVRQVYLYL
jgi:hypothetical protein